jgi:hypothetical protein
MIGWSTKTLSSPILLSLANVASKGHIPQKHRGMRIDHQQACTALKDPGATERELLIEGKGNRITFPETCTVRS